MTIDVEAGDLESLSPKELDVELRRIYSSFSDDFKVAAAQILRKKVRERSEVISQDEYLLAKLQENGKTITKADISAMAWVEISLESMMILVDNIRGQKEQLDAVRHLMPTVSTRKQ